MPPSEDSDLKWEKGKGCIRDERRGASPLWVTRAGEIYHSPLPRIIRRNLLTPGSLAVGMVFARLQTVPTAAWTRTGARLHAFSFQYASPLGARPSVETLDQAVVLVVGHARAEPGLVSRSLRSTGWTRRTGNGLEANKVHGEMMCNMLHLVSPSR